MVTKESFQDWKANPVTKAVFNLLKDQIKGLQEELGNHAGIDSGLDRYKVGYIKACIDMLEVNCSEVQEND